MRVYIHEGMIYGWAYIHEGMVCDLRHTGLTFADRPITIRCMMNLAVAAGAISTPFVFVFGYIHIGAYMDHMAWRRRSR